MSSFLRSTVLLIFRGKSIQAIGILALFITFIALLGTNFSARHPQTLALDLGLSLQRIVLSFFSIYWVQEFLAKDIENKTVISMLAYPSPRWHYLLGRYQGIMAMSALSILVIALLLVSALSLFQTGYRQATPIDLGLPFIATCFYQFVDIAVLVAFTTLIATISTTPFLPMACGLLFTICGHSLGPTIDILLQDRSLLENQDIYRQMLEASKYILPNLDVLDIRAWALYGAIPSNGFVWPLIMASGYAGACLLIAVNRFNARQFT